MAQVVESDSSIGLDTLVAELERRGDLEAVGGASFVAGLVDGVVPDRASIEHYVEIVRDMWVLRQLCHVGESLCRQAYGPKAKPLELLADYDKRLSELRLAAEATVRAERLRSLKIEPGSLIVELEQFFAERAFLPEGVALVLALWAMNTWVFDVFDTTPYLLLESAVPECGKTTVLHLLNEVCRQSVLTSSASEAALFRVIEKHHPALLVDEAEILAEKGERSQALRSILNAGYKRGGKALRCDGESHEPRLFDTYSPKAMASIGGLQGALLDRCIVLTMHRRPPSVRLKSLQSQHIRRAAIPLREKLEAYALRVREEIARMYEKEPESGYWPQLRDREAELWGPLLYHARLAGAAVEARALDVALHLSRAKVELQGDDRNFALARELLEALSTLRSAGQEKFSPGDLLVPLRDAEAWGEALAGKREDRERAAGIGRFIGRYRLASRERPHGKTLYQTAEAIEKISASLPFALARTAATEASAAKPVNTRIRAAAVGCQGSDQRWGASAVTANIQGSSAAGKGDRSAIGKMETAATATCINGDLAADAADNADTVNGAPHCWIHPANSADWWLRGDDLVCGRCHPNPN